MHTRYIISQICKPEVRHYPEVPYCDAEEKRLYKKMTSS